MGLGVSRVATDMSIGELQFEINRWHLKNPTICLTWRAPTDHHSPRDIEYVIYANEQEIQVVPGVRTSVTLKTLRPLKRYTFKVVTRDKGTKEEGLYYQTFEVFLDWKCKSLECEKSRWEITDPIYLSGNEESLIYDYCSVQDKVVWEVDHCVHKECRREPAHNSFFCSDEHDAHRFLAKQQGEARFVLCQPSSRKFQEMEQTFHKDWDKGKDLSPVVCMVIAIVNPFLEDSLEAYKSSLRRWHQKTEFHYHGTKLKCPLHKYFMPCQQNDCSICGISRNGFLLEHTSADYHHFAKAFYLAPKSSKCHDYCATQNGQNSFHSMLYCEVVTGKKYHLKRKETFTDGPPDGYNTVYGKSIQMPFLHGDSTNEELVVFNEDAICPKYIVCYKITQT